MSQMDKIDLISPDQGPDDFDPDEDALAFCEEEGLFLNADGNWVYPEDQDEGLDADGEPVQPEATKAAADEEARDDHGRWTAGGEIAERPATAVEKRSAIQEGFDASQSRVWEARDSSGKSLGALWWSPGNEADPNGLTIHALHVEEDSRRQGVATALLDHMLDKFAGHAVDPGGMTPEGEQLWQKWMPIDFPEVNGVWWLEYEDEDDDA